LHAANHSDAKTWQDMYIYTLLALVCLWFESETAALASSSTPMAAVDKAPLGHDDHNQ
jgi:hypothetical protein